ncbi:hypothetical protein [Pseudomonas phage vB_Pae_CF74b]|nr:hypothetical protein [Pseudomonas phage vB_Pae_CF74b]QBI80546.1 hypothetical protein [Pseudomonas phage vB_Pae_CF136b]
MKIDPRLLKIIIQVFPVGPARKSASQKSLLGQSVFFKFFTIIFHMLCVRICEKIYDPHEGRIDNQSN